MDYIEKAFETIGSRLKIGDIAQRNNSFRRIVNRANGRIAHFVVNIGRDNNGEFFKIDTDGSVKFHIMGVDKNNHHLLLLARDSQNAKYRFLCGLDEKGWFAAAVPEAVSYITDAMDALKPAQIIGAQKHLKPKNKNKRKNAAFLRQGGMNSNLSDGESVRIICSENSWIEGDAVRQLQQASTLDGIVYSVGLPDIHPGK